MKTVTYSDLARLQQSLQDLREARRGAPAGSAARTAVNVAIAKTAALCRKWARGPKADEHGQPYPETWPKDPKRIVCRFCGAADPDIRTTESAALGDGAVYLLGGNRPGDGPAYDYADSNLADNVGAVSYTCAACDAEAEDLRDLLKPAPETPA